MTITFISNYINHHQIPFSEALYKRLGESYHFVQTEPMEEERVAMGWSREGEMLPYVHRLYEEEELCRRLVLESDVLLAGWSGREDLIGERLAQGKLTLRISERLYREGQWKAISPRGLAAKYKEHTQYRKSPVYLLCAGAYVPSDFHIIRAYPDKMFKWGYFPEFISYTREELMGKKDSSGKVHIVWAGRFIPLKHPEYMLRLAASLRDKEQELQGEKSGFHIHMVGGGLLEEQLKVQAADRGLEEYITFYGFCSPQQVRRIMEQGHIFVFTSNHLEGWGAVVNEAMNSGCAVAANVQAGAVPYLIRHKKNGMVYRDGSYGEMEAAVQYLLEDQIRREEMGWQAYKTIADQWNAEHAAGELLRMIEEWKTGKTVPSVEGPLSPAPVIAPAKMYERMLQEAEKGGA